MTGQKALIFLCKYALLDSTYPKERMPKREQFIKKESYGDVSPKTIENATKPFWMRVTPE